MEYFSYRMDLLLELLTLFIGQKQKFLRDVWIYRNKSKRLQNASE